MDSIYGFNDIYVFLTLSYSFYTSLDTSLYTSLYTLLDT